MLKEFQGHHTNQAYYKLGIMPPESCKNREQGSQASTLNYSLTANVSGCGDM